MSTKTPDFLGMDDEEFQNLNYPPSAEGEVEETEEIETLDPTPENEIENVEELPDDSDKPAGENDSPIEPEEPEVPVDEDSTDPEKEEPEKEAEIEDEIPKKDGKESEKLEKEDPEKQETEAPVDYKAFYEKVMAPFNANGKTIQLNSPEEAIQLQQMGANYTRKMQDIAPYRKVLLMLENNKLLDEDKLSYLIDLDRKNPDAIKKLVKDSGIDPIDIDTEEESTYRTGNHRVSDEEAAFRGVLDELGSNPNGKETLHLINTQWDQASKEVLWTQPEVMQVIHEQRSNGIYDRIATEVERQRTLGAIPPQVPFLQAYKKIGDDLAQAGAFNDLVQQTPAPVQQPQPSAAPVAKRVASPKSPVANGDKASAASPTRSTPRKAATIVNPLSLPDDEFEKQFANWQGRV